MHAVTRAVVAASSLVLAAPACGDDADDASTTTPAPATDTSATSTETTGTTGATTATTAPAVDVDTATAVFPLESQGDRFDDPVEAATAFAVGYLGFVDPVVSEFRQGDSRSGEVGISPRASGPETTVFVRLLGDDTWWILGAASPDIVVTEPSAGQIVGSPMTLAGEALAFEGNVQVQIWPDGADEPIVDTNVTGGGDVMRPFETTLTFDTPAALHGALVLRTYSAETGAVEQAGVLRIGF